MKQKTDNTFEGSSITNCIEIEITNYCSLNCITCPRKQFEKFGFISLDDFIKIVDFIKEGNYTELLFCGFGDDFLHKDFNKILDYVFLKLPNIKLFLTTKGQSINDIHLKKIKELNDKGHFISIAFSIFSLKKDLHNNLIGGDYYNKLFDVINKCNTLNIDYSLEFLLSTLTLKELNKSSELAKNLNKVRGLSLVHNWGGALKKSIHEKLFSEKLLKGYFTKRDKNDICEVMKRNFLYINHLGEVFQCPLNCLSREGYLGKIGEYSHAEFIEKKNNLDYNKVCRNCFYYNYKTYETSPL